MFPNNQNPGGQVTGAEDDFSAFVKQAVAEEMAKQQGQNQGGAPQLQNEPAPIPVTLNGQTVNFSNPNELNQALAQYSAHMQGQIDTLKNQSVAPPQSTGAQVTGQEDFDIAKYVNYMTTDPLKAAEYVDQKRFGVDNPVQAIKDAISTKTELGQVKQALDVYRFRDAHPEFSANPQNAQTLQNIISQASLNPDYNGLEAAYAIALTRGMIQVPQQQQNQQYPQNFQQNPYGQQGQQQPPQWGQFNQPPQNPYQGYQNAPPPRVGRQGAGPAEDYAALAESMTPEQLESIISRFQ